MPLLLRPDHYLIEMVICAWCHAIVTRLRNVGRGRNAQTPVSHGICPSCLRSQLAPQR